MIELLIFLIIFIGLELFESTWQKADTFYGVIKNNYLVYQKSLLLYFVANPTFIYTLFLSFYLNNFTFWLSILVVIKFVDISFRLYLLQLIDRDESISNIIPIDMNMNNYLRYINVIIYPFCFLFANIL